MKNNYEYDNFNTAMDAILKANPQAVKDAMGHALHFGPARSRHSGAKPLSGFVEAGVLEVVEDASGDTYRGVYTV